MWASRSSGFPSQVKVTSISPIPIPGVSDKSIEFSREAESVRAIRRRLKPSAETSMGTTPAGAFSIRKRPSSSVVALSVVPAIRTLAPTKGRLLMVSFICPLSTASPELSRAADAADRDIISGTRSSWVERERPPSDFTLITSPVCSPATRHWKTCVLPTALLSILSISSVLRMLLLLMLLSRMLPSRRKPMFPPLKGRYDKTSRSGSTASRRICKFATLA